MFKLEEGWATVLLLAALVVIAAWGVEAPGWAPGLWTASVTGAVGVLAGLALSKSRFNGLIATLFAAVYGVFTVGFLVGQILSRDWHRRTIEMLIRLNNFLYYALHGGTSRDILPFPIFVGLVFWAIGVGGAWSLFRRGAAWPAILPGGILLLISAYYYVGNRLELDLAAYLVLALLLLTRMNLLAQEREWLTARIAYTQEARFEFLRAGLTTAVVIVGLAWVGQRVTAATAAPQAAAAWQQVGTGWSSVRENFERLFNSVRNPGLSAQDFYGDSLTLGGATSLSTNQVMAVTVGPVNENGPDQSGDAAASAPVPRYYWRAAVYPEYTDGRWQAGSALEYREQTPAHPTVRLPAERLRRDISAVFTMQLQSVSRLYVLPQPRLVDRAATFEAFVADGGALDPVAVRAQTILSGNDRRYQVVASVSVADAESLRGAGQSYPDWIKAFFLQMPDTITPRTRALARQIVADAKATTPYDQTQAITDWLRGHMAYDLNITAPPAGAEPVDWFLFESKRGYCNYYASAEVMLLRSLGIPARLAVGFAQGGAGATDGQYIVLERDAHAWPEVYFPSYGWIEFEPTAIQPPLARPLRSVVADTPAPAVSGSSAPPRDLPRDNADPAEPPAVAPSAVLLALLSKWSSTFSVGAAGVGILLLLALGFLLRQDLIGLDSLGQPGQLFLRWLGRRVPTTVTQAYRELERAARWLGLQLPPHLTPIERAAQLSAALPEIQDGVHTITAQYLTEQYSASPQQADGPAARAAWRAIRGRVWQTGLRQTLRRWTDLEAWRRPTEPASPPSLRR